MDPMSISTAVRRPPSVPPCALLVVWLTTEYNPVLYFFLSFFRWNKRLSRALASEQPSINQLSFAPTEFHCPRLSAETAFLFFLFVIIIYLHSTQKIWDEALPAVIPWVYYFVQKKKNLDFSLSASERASLIQAVHHWIRLSIHFRTDNKSIRRSRLIGLSPLSRIESGQTHFLIPLRRHKHTSSVDTYTHTGSWTLSNYRRGKKKRAAKSGPISKLFRLFQFIKWRCCGGVGTPFFRFFLHAAHNSRG